VLEARAPTIPAEWQYLPEPVWRETRGYVEVVCTQLNGCFLGTASALRRIVPFDRSVTTPHYPCVIVWVFSNFPLRNSRTWGSG